MIKKILLIATALMTFILFVLLVVALTIFRWPTIVINPQNIDWALTKANVLKQWSWDEADIQINWITWNNRNLKGNFKNLCFDYKSEALDAKSCIEDISWDFDISWKYKVGFDYLVRNAFTVNSSATLIQLHEAREEIKEQKEAPFIPPDIRNYWSILWSGVVPDLILKFQKIEILKENKELLNFDIALTKTKEDLRIHSYGVSLFATKDFIEVRGPEKFRIPVDVKTAKPLDLKSIVLKLEMNKNPIPVSLTSELDKVEFSVVTNIEFPMKENYLQEIVSLTKLNVDIKKINEALSAYMFPPFNILPAPLNSLEGPLNIKGEFEKGRDKNEVVAKIKTELDLKGEKQALHFIIAGEVPFNLDPFNLGAISLDLDIRKVLLLLPKLSKTSLPPQLMPDSRINTAVVEEKEVKAEGGEVNLKLKLEALGDDTLSISTNLLDEPIRLNFDLLFSEGQIQKGYVKLLTLNTSIFKRKIQVSKMDVNFNAPEEPELDAKIEFLLPEYKITLNLDGPISSPRYFFSSDPLLPLDDIYAVLLFGRPLLDLNVDDRTSAGQTNRLLSQGILSLSVLYFFAGSPVESIGYDPSTNEISAQIGLGNKSSLRVGGTQDGGFSSAGVRRSLGKGWYLDTSVQKTSTPTSSNVNDYGVLLERIIAY